jgi:hypothetical protein
MPIAEVCFHQALSVLSEFKAVITNHQRATEGTREWVPAWLFAFMIMIQVKQGDYWTWSCS